MFTQLPDDQQVADAHETTDPTTAQMQNLMAQLVRQGQDTSLRSLQVWADLARQLGATTQVCTPAAATRVCLAYDLLEKLHAGQREVVDELVATQRQLAQRCLDATVGDGLTHR